MKSLGIMGQTFEEKPGPGTSCQRVLERTSPWKLGTPWYLQYQQQDPQAALGAKVPTPKPSPHVKASP